MYTNVRVNFTCALYHKTSLVTASATLIVLL